MPGVSVERLDEERIELLGRWGEGLAHDGRDEVRAAGRAISILIEEIERLHVDLWKERSLRGALTPAGVTRAPPNRTFKRASRAARAVSPQAQSRRARRRTRLSASRSAPRVRAAQTQTGCANNAVCSEIEFVHPKASARAHAAHD